MNQIKFLTEMLYSQLGMTLGILDGSADPNTLVNYANRILDPIVSTFADEMTRKFISKKARTEGQKIYIFQDPFKLIPIKDMAEIADKFTRNEIMSSNEFRSKIGMKPSKAPGADDLRNKNLNPPTGSLPLSSDINNISKEGGNV